MTRLAMLAALALSVAGCVSAADLEALGKDQNAVCATATSIWVTIHVDRNHGCSPAASP